MWGERFGTRGAWWVYPSKDGMTWRPFESVHDSDRGNIATERTMSKRGTVTTYQEDNCTNLVFDSEHCELETVVEAFARTEPPYHFAYHLEGWCHRVCPTRRQAINCLSQIFHREAEIIVPRDLTVTQVDPDKSGDPGFWRAIANEPDNHLDRMVVFREMDGLRYDQIGERAPVKGILGPDWALDVQGRPFDRGLSDHEFDVTTAEAYSRVLESGTPELSRVMGPLETPHGVVHQDYHRMIVRLGRQTVGSLSLLAPDVGPPCP